MLGADSPGGLEMAMGSFYGGYIFCATMVVANVIVNASKPVLMPKYSTIKELSFYGCSILIITIFGFFEFNTIIFVVIYAFLYILYILSSILINNYEKK